MGLAVRGGGPVRVRFDGSKVTAVVTCDLETTVADVVERAVAVLKVERPCRPRGALWGLRTDRGLTRSERGQRESEGTCSDTYIWT